MPLAEITYYAFHIKRVGAVIMTLFTSSATTATPLFIGRDYCRHHDMPRQALFNWCEITRMPGFMADFGRWLASSVASWHWPLRRASKAPRYFFIWLIYCWYEYLGYASCLCNASLPSTTLASDSAQHIIMLTQVGRLRLPLCQRHLSL